MKVVIRTKASIKSRSGVGSLSITVNKQYRKINAVVFSREQAEILRAAADNACKKIK